MKLKKIRVRLKDIHHGKVLYVAHPEFGIDVVTIVGKPYLNKAIHSLFISTATQINWIDKETTHIRDRSLSDMGVYKLYGYRRTFHTRRQAQQYVERTRNCPHFQEYARELHWSRYSSDLFD